MKRKFTMFALGLALAIALNTGGGIVAESLGFDIVPNVSATGCSGGGGC